MHRRRDISHPLSHSGLTVIEVSVVLMILGLMMAVTIPGLGLLMGANLRQQAGQLSSGIRWLYNYSAMNNLHCRLVFDLDARSYEAQCSEEVFTLAAEREKADDGAGPEEEDEDSAATTTFGLSDEAREEAEMRNHKVSFTPATGDSVEVKAALPEGIFFDGVWTGHQEERYTKGKAYLYFFPQGFAEPATIHMATENGAFFTIEVQPLTGRTIVTPDFVEIPRQ